MSEEGLGSAVEETPVPEAVPAEPTIATPDEVKAVEKEALNIHKKLNIQSAPIRHYLEGTVVPVLMQGLQAVCKERPDNPVEYLAYYLLSHNPQNAKATSIIKKATPAAAPEAQPAT